MLVVVGVADLYLFVVLRLSSLNTQIMGSAGRTEHLEVPISQT